MSRLHKGTLGNYETMYLANSPCYVSLAMTPLHQGDTVAVLDEHGPFPGCRNTYLVKMDWSL